MSMMLGIYTAPPSQGGTLVLDATPFAEGVTASTNDHGFEALPATIPMLMVEAFRMYTSSTLYAALIRDNTIVWEGRLEDPSVYAGANGSGLNVQALGAWRALTDDRYIALWSTTSVADWRVLTTEDAAGLVPEKAENDTNNRLYIAARKNETFSNAVTNALGFLIPDRSSREIIGVQYDWEFKAPNATWRFLIRSASSAWVAATTIQTVNGNGAVQTGSTNSTFAAAPNLRLDLNYNAAAAIYAGETGDCYIKFTNIRIVTTTTNRINTTLGTTIAAGTRTVTPAAMTGIYVGQRLRIGGAVHESVVVTAITSTTFTAVFAQAHNLADPVQAFLIYADEIAKDIVSQISTLNSTQLSSSTTLIQSPGVDLNDEIYEDQSPADVLIHLTGLGDNQTTPRQWEVGVWERRVLHFRPRGDAAKAWYVDVTDLGIARTLEDLSNSVYADYKDPNDRTLRTTNSTDSTSIARYGLTRRSNIVVDTTSNVQATVQVSAQLADHKDPLPRATVAFDAVYDAGGARWPLWLVRSGDTITIRNLPPTITTSVNRIQTFRISHTTYTPATRSLAVELEVPPPRLATLLARRAEGIR